MSNDLLCIENVEAWLNRAAFGDRSQDTNAVAVEARHFVREQAGGWLRALLVEVRRQQEENEALRTAGKESQRAHFETFAREHARVLALESERDQVVEATKKQRDHATDKWIEWKNRAESSERECDALLMRAERAEATLAELWRLLRQAEQVAHGACTEISEERCDR